MKKEYIIVLIAKILKPKLYLAHKGTNKELCEQYLD